jgi:DNA-binding CsgD family transcriptional regulator/PAS domain-containing protein
MVVGSDRRLFSSYPSILTEIQNRLAQIRLGHAFWCSFTVSQGRRFSLILHREAEDDRDLSKVEEGVLRELIPHMERSTRLRLSLENSSSRSAHLEHALKHLGLALVICDTDLRIRWSNEAADALLAQAQHLRIAGGRLETQGAADMANLRHMISRVASGEPDSMVGVVAAGAGDPVQIRALQSPVISSSLERDQVALFLSRPNLANFPDPRDLGILYQLTPAEARLAAAIAGGSSLSSYSAQRGIAVGTARNQLKRVLMKTYTHSQSDLVRTLCNSAASRSKSLSH